MPSYFTKLMVDGAWKAAGPFCHVPLNYRYHDSYRNELSDEMVFRFYEENTHGWPSKVVDVRVSNLILSKPDALNIIFKKNKIAATLFT